MGEGTEVPVVGNGGAAGVIGLPERAAVLQGGRTGHELKALGDTVDAMLDTGLKLEMLFQRYDDQCGAVLEGRGRVQVQAGLPAWMLVGIDAWRRGAEEDAAKRRLADVGSRPPADVLDEQRRRENGS